MVNVLIVDDSPVMREMISEILKKDPEINVLGIVEDGKEAVNALEKLNPDIILMDFNMPVMDGLEATRQIMKLKAIPIVIMSATVKNENVSFCFKAVEAGALILLAKPSPSSDSFNQECRNLRNTLKALSEVKVIRRRNPSSPDVIQTIHLDSNAKNEKKIIGIGASTGGPLELQQILSKLPETLPVPIVIVQHIAVDFVEGLVDWLNTNSPIKVVLAKSEEILLPGRAYVAPGGFQLKVADNKIHLEKDEEANKFAPSVSCLFESLALNYGSKAIGVLLTGMGKDGAKELLMMKQKGSYTIVQDRNSSAVYGMPGEAVRLDAHCVTLPTEKIPGMILNLLNSDNRRPKNESE